MGEVPLAGLLHDREERVNAERVVHGHAEDAHHRRAAVVALSLQAKASEAGERGMRVGKSQHEGKVHMVGERERKRGGAN